MWKPKLALVLVSAIAILAIQPSTGGARPNSDETEYAVSQAIAYSKERHKLESVLTQLVANYEVGGPGGAAVFAKKSGVALQQGMVRAVIEAEKDKGPEVARLASAMGAVVETSYADLVQIKTEPSLLRSLTTIESVRFVRLPAGFKNMGQLVESEGVPLVGASSWQSAGWSGQGVKLGVLDLDFAGYQSLLGTELPSTVVVRSFRADGNIEGGDSGSSHGTAVAEIVHDMAPDAELFFANYETELEFAQAVDWLIQQKVKIISHSAGSFTQPLDGSGFIDKKVNEAAARGIVWVNAAGNHSEKHYSGAFTDRASFGWQEFFGSRWFPIAVPAAKTGEPNIGVVLTWDDWPLSRTDYDLFLFDTRGNILAFSATPQTGSQPPIETIVGLLSVPPGCTGDPLSDSGCVVYAAVRGQGAGRNIRFSLWTVAGQGRYSASAGSVVSPATAEGAWAVGATDYVINTPKAYSSEGPTWDGRTKPDFAAPSGVSTVTYGPSKRPMPWFGFEGTSASAPYVAGAAALVWSANPSLRAGDVMGFLEERAIDLGGAGKDNVFGAGLLQLGTPTRPGESNKFLAVAEGSGSVAVSGGYGDFAFGVGKRSNSVTEGWFWYTAPGLGVLRAKSVGVLAVRGNDAGFWGFGLFDDGQTYSFNVRLNGDSSGEDRLGISIWNAGTGVPVHQVEGILASGRLIISGDSPKHSLPPYP